MKGTVQCVPESINLLVGSASLASPIVISVRGGPAPNVVLASSFLKIPAPDAPPPAKPAPPHHPAQPALVPTSC